MNKRNMYLFTFTLLAIGVGGIIAQTVLLRELLVVFAGNEFSIGIIIGFWVIWEAAGAYLGGLKEMQLRTGIRSLACLSVLFSVFLPISIYGARTFKVLAGIPVEIGVGLIPILYTSSLVLLPVGLIHGFLFTLACSIWDRLTAEGTRSSGKVYFYEMVGTIAGGIIVNFLLVPHYQSFQIALLVACFTAGSCIILLVSFSRLTESPALAFSAAVIISSVILLAGGGADRLHRLAVERQWQGRNVVYYENSVYQNIVVTQRDDQYTFFLDALSILTVPVPDIAFVEEFVHFPMLVHPFPKNVLVLGGGAGGVINEILKHPSVKRIDYVEIDPAFLKTVMRFSTPLTTRELSNPLVHLHFLDGRMFLKRALRGYDVILLGVQPPHTLQQNRFFTQEFFGDVQKALRKGGILALTMTGSLTYYSTELKDLNSSILASLKGVFPHTFVVPGDSNLFLASGSPTVSSVSPILLSDRLKTRDIATSLISGTHLAHRLQPERRVWFSSLLEGRTIPANHDFSPKALFYYIAYQNLLFSPSISRLFTAAEAVRPLGAASFLALLFLASALLRRTYSRLPVAYAIGTTGFTAMIMELVLLFSFQVFYGYIFYEIGLLLTLFMAGMATGGIVASAPAFRKVSPVTLLTFTDLFLAIFALILSLIFLSFGSAFLSGSPLSYPILLILLFVSGFLPGAEFPLAAMGYARTVNATEARTGDTVGRTVGFLYGVDLVGGWIGGLVGGFLLLPVLGLTQSLLLLVVLKAGSLLLLATSPKK